MDARARIDADGALAMVGFSVDLTCFTDGAYSPANRNVARTEHPMAQRRKPTALVKIGFAIAVAAFAVILALGFSSMTVPQPSADSATVGCGSVFGPEDQSLCDSVLSNRENLMLAIGIPGVVIGLGIVVVGSRLQDNR